MTAAGDTGRDGEYRELLLDPMRKSAGYAPKMGRRAPVSLRDFGELYGADPLYSWVGLDSPLMYAAHKAAGGMTSIYRQLGIGCERLWRRVIRDQLALTAEQSGWSYRTPSAAGAQRTLRLDGRIDRRHVAERTAQARVEGWLDRARSVLEVSMPVDGVVFEVRQGYKSKDSKRQNADIDNASHALKNAYIPAATVLSLQVDRDIQLRYRQNNWIVLTGSPESDDDLTSCYAFSRNVLAYDLAGFFARNAGAMRREVHDQSMSFRPNNGQAPLFARDVRAWSVFRTEANAILAGAEADLPGRVDVRLGDARSLDRMPGAGAGLILTSPPYANRMSYIRELRPYMYWLRFLRRPGEAGDLDWKAIGGTWGAATSRVGEWEPDGDIPLGPGFTATLAAIRGSGAKHAGLLSRYVEKYFHDMWRHFRSAHSILSGGGRAIYIVGNSTFYGEIVPTQDWCAALLEAAGFGGVSVRKIRKRNSNKALFEYLVEGRRP